SSDVCSSDLRSVVVAYPRPPVVVSGVGATDTSSCSTLAPVPDTAQDSRHTPAAVYVSGAVQVCPPSAVVVTGVVTVPSGAVTVSAAWVVASYGATTSCAVTRSPTSGMSASSCAGGRQVRPRYGCRQRRTGRRRRELRPLGGRRQLVGGPLPAPAHRQRPGRGAGGAHHARLDRLPRPPRPPALARAADERPLRRLPRPRRDRAASRTERHIPAAPHRPARHHGPGHADTHPVPGPDPPGRLDGHRAPDG